MFGQYGNKTFQIKPKKNSGVLYKAKLDVVEITQEISKLKTKAISPFEIDSKRFSSLNKLLRVTSWVGRFIKKTEKESNKYRTYTDFLNGLC